MDKSEKSYQVNKMYLAGLVGIHKDPDFIAVDIIMAYDLFLLACKGDKEVIERYITLMRESIDFMEEQLLKKD